jgi:hypothetical protein
MPPEKSRMNDGKESGKDSTTKAPRHKEVSEGHVGFSDSSGAGRKRLKSD